MVSLERKLRAQERKLRVQAGPEGGQS